jgi:probable rRNA maturation factor
VTAAVNVTPVVVVRDEQTAESVDPDRWGRLAADVLAAEGEAGELNLLFVDEAAMAELNRSHLGHEGPTDVLSFPIDGVGAGADGLLGDVVVCPAVARRNAPDHAGTYEAELALLVVHGILHVLGHDHAEADEAARMRAREVAHLERFGP